MIVNIDTSEWYPVYGEGLFGHGRAVDIPADLWGRYLEARERFSDLLSEVEDIVNQRADTENVHG